MAKHRRSNRGPHDYPRTARLNELIRQIVAEEVERLDDERLELATIVAVDVEADLHSATVYVTGLGGPDADAEVVAALADHRRGLQAAINRQSRFKRTPELVFAADEVTRSADRIESILRDLRDGDEGDDAGGAGGEDEGDDAVDGG